MAKHSEECDSCGGNGCTRCDETGENEVYYNDHSEEEEEDDD